MRTLSNPHIPVRRGITEHRAAHNDADLPVGLPVVPSFDLNSLVEAACRLPYTTMNPAITHDDREPQQNPRPHEKVRDNNVFNRGK